MWFLVQVYELHRLYRIQKMLMRDISKNSRIDPHYRAGPRQCERPVEYDQSDLELTLGPKSYYETKGGVPGIRSGHSGTSFSSSSTGSSHMKGGPRSMKWGPETPLSSQDRLNSSGPWLFHALSLNSMTWYYYYYY